MRYGALDPGASTGYAIYVDDKPVEMGTIPWGHNAQGVYNWLDFNYDLDVLIVENYRILPEEFEGKRRANTWSESHESQIIGMARYACFHYDIELVIQEPSIKPAGYGYCGMKYVKGKKGMHKEDALAHGMFWYMEKGRKRGKELP